MVDAPNPEGGEQGKSPKGNWEAKPKSNPHWVEVATLVILAVVGFFQICIYFKQASIMQTQANIMGTQTHILKIDKRPWIKTTVTIRKPLLFTDWSNQKGISASLEFELKNYGEAPATNVRVGAEIAVHPGNPKRSELSAPQEKTCAAARTEAAKNPIGGFAIFPNDPASAEQGSGLSGIYLTDEPILFAVVGCIVYTFAETEQGETGFRMMLGRIVGNQIVGLPFIEGAPKPYEQPVLPELLAKGYPAKPPNVGLLQPNEFIFRPEDEGNYAK
jgi:hypothetical protein